MSKKQKNLLIRIIISAVLLTGFTILTRFIELPWFIALPMFLIPYGILGYKVIIKAVKGIIKGQVCDENFLMAVATVGAMALGDYKEAVAVILFYQIGELFESYAVGKSRRNIASLMDIRPDYANIEQDGELVKVDPYEVSVGTVIVVKPGEKVPIDGKIVDGNTSLDTSALTGESVPRTAKSGDEVISGCINLSGVIKIETTKEFEESTVSKILDLVENASSKKSKSENFISKFARYYTPAVCILALALALIPPVLYIFVGKEPMWMTWIYRGLTFLVISCPCALVISIPLTFFAGLGGAGKQGVLIKGSNYLETLSKTEYILFDKTGTVTQGVFEVTGIHHNDMEDMKLLELAALVESRSTHPIAKSIVRACESIEFDFDRITELEEISGHGIHATVDGQDFLIGNHRLMEKYSVEYIDCHHIGTIVHIAINGEYAGHIVISDVVKETAPEALRMLRNYGIKREVMLTGDSESVASDVSQKLGIDEHFANLLPSDKVSKVEEYLEIASGKLAFVGDGINDAPVLSRADIGIAMGALGSDAAIEAADVVLMDDNPLKIVTAIRAARKCMRIVYENIGFALGVKAVCLILGAFGIANMWVAIFADVGVMVIAVLNAIRALRIR